MKPPARIKHKFVDDSDARTPCGHRLFPERLTSYYMTVARGKHSDASIAQDSTKMEIGDY
jgi:hypothetical protein